MTWQTDEESVQNSLPKELYQIDFPTVTYRLASSEFDVVADGVTYRASSISRSTLGISSISKQVEMLFDIDARHAVVRDFLRNGIPQKFVLVTIRRKQVNGDVVKIWSGPLTSLAFNDRHKANFRVPARGQEQLLNRLPVIAAGQLCSHILYDARCGVSRSVGFTVNTTVVSTDGKRQITVASMGGQADQWAQFGEFLHLPSNERMTVVSQVGTSITIQLPIHGLQVGDAVQVFAGCAHDIFTCRIKFSNQVNYGGFPQLPRANVFLPNGLGVWTSE